jgi:hypothetical protein
MLRREGIENKSLELEIIALTPEEIQFLIDTLPDINKSFRTNTIAPIETLNCVGENDNSSSLVYIGEVEEAVLGQLQETLAGKEKITINNKVQETKNGLAHNHHTIIFDLGNGVYGIIEVDNEPYKIGDEIYIQKGWSAAEAYLILPSLKVLGFTDSRFPDETSLLQVRFRQSIMSLIAK